MDRKCGIQYQEIVIIAEGGNFLLCFSIKAGYPVNVLEIYDNLFITKHSPEIPAIMTSADS